jgi:phospholipase A1
MSKKLCCLVAVFVASCSLTAVGNAQPAKTTKHHYFRNYYGHQTPKPSISDEEWDKIKKDMESVTPDKRSMISEKLQQIQEIQKNPAGIAFYEPTYILPYAYTTSVSPWYAQHPGNTPDSQKVEHAELKAQLSFIIPVWTQMFHAPFDLSFSYTQLNYWQVYANSPYFRETNYEPQAFLTYTGVHNWLFSLGMDHQSNGRGGVGYDGMERSWNRVFANISFSGEHWLVNIMPWIPVFKSSQRLHNSNITRYLGYSRVVFAYKYHRQEVSLMIRNAVESGFSRGALQLSYTFPLYGKIKGMVTFFSGYGQSLIEYDHYTNAYGVGIALSDWM